MHVGLIGGIGPAATDVYYRSLIARAANAQQRTILEKMGVKEILSPEDTVGQSVAEMLLHPNMKSFMALPDDYEIVEVNTPGRIVNSTVGEVGLRERSFTLV